MSDIKKTLILASTSKSRQKLLKDSGVILDKCIDSEICEDTIKNTMVSHSISEVALELALQKAKAVSMKYKDAYVIGGDQMLSLDNQRFDKPKSLEELKNNLLNFSGKKHILHSGLVVMQNGKIIFSGNYQAKMYVRPLSEDFINMYVNTCGEKVLSSVGGYHFEGLGSQLFEKIDGDYFTILGLPLLPLLDFLRSENIIQK